MTMSTLEETATANPDFRLGSVGEKRSLRARLGETFRRYWYLGFTSFGGPGVHVVILKRTFVTTHQWLSPKTFSDLFALGNALPGPGSTQLAFSIALVRNGTVAGFLGFFLWSLPASIGMTALALGISRLPPTLPDIALAILTGLNAAAVGLIALAAYQLSLGVVTDKVTRGLVLVTASAGICYHAPWMYPVLVGGGGITTLIWDFRSVILRKLHLDRTLKLKLKRSRRRGDSPSASHPPASRPQAGRDRDLSPEQEPEVDRIERIELPELGSGAEDTIMPVVSRLEVPHGKDLEQPEPAKYRDYHSPGDGKYDMPMEILPLPFKGTGGDTGVDVDVERQAQARGQGVRQRQTQKRQEKQDGAFPTTADLQQDQQPAEVQVNEEIHTLPAKTAAAIFVLFVTLVVTFVVLKTTLSQPSREMSLFTNMLIAGTIICGGGPVVIPLLRGYTVDPGWVNSRDFLLGFAILQAFPGPNFAFAAYLGVLAVPWNPVLGALLGYIGIFAPGILLKLALLPLYKDWREYAIAKSALRGLNAAAVGLIYTAVWQLFLVGHIYTSAEGTTTSTVSGALTVDPWWGVVAGASFAATQWYHLPPPVSVLSGAIAGLIWYGVTKN
ncbi:hypothetical protein FFLO_05042 [Filobasidium floriforme]|uniref:Chromate ion transporter n=1 Tax=Filobasidium floriforme TaxID=5210 RepID=A0A8K0JHN7_9TREE|nr:chromate transporter-domain-containing protein [Filobasidium floriforme]KAG7530443.1 hypothetical protein FFLO_05042 [Filobasidium floriforme]KAH8078571.1 chromate transporter-domain-containing protein [Filobasidium floriforme]